MKQYLIYDNKTVIAIMKGLRRISMIFTRVVSTPSIRKLIVLCTASQYKCHAQLHSKSSIHSLTLHVLCTISQYSTRFMHNFANKFHAKVHYLICMLRFTEPVLCTAFHYKFHALFKIHCSGTSGFMHHKNVVSYITRLSHTFLSLVRY